MSTFFSTPLFQRILLGILLLASMSLLWNMFKLPRSRGTTDELKLEVQQLRSSVESLQQEVEEEESVFEKESIIRNDLHMQKEGEIILQLPIPSPGNNELPQPTVDPTPNYKKWFAILF